MYAWIWISLCIAITIGFELPRYTYTEPQSEEFIDKLYVSPTGRPENGPIFLVKEDNVTTVQTFLFSVQVIDSAPSDTNIQSATIDQDYCIRTFLSGGTVITNVTGIFPARDQRIPFGFTLFPDTLPEGTEAFQASVSLEDSQLLPDGTEESFPTMALISEGLISEIFVVIEDDDQLVFGFSRTEYEIHESDGSVTVEIILNHEIAGDYQPIVLISTHNGRAIEGADFTAIISSQVSFTTGNRVKHLSIPIISSNSTESSEEFTVTLDEVILVHTNNSYYSTLNLSDQGIILNPRVASITILDDNMAVIGFLNSNINIFEGEGELNFTIGVLQGYLDTFVTIFFMTEASSAKAGLDYIETSKFLNFTGPEDSVQTVSIQITDDGISEPSETFFGLLSSADGTLIPPNVHLEPNRATATIINENGSNSIVTVLVVVLVLVCTLVFFTLIMTALYFLLKKYKRKTNLPGHVRDSVSPPRSRPALFSEPIYPNLNTRNLS